MFTQALFDINKSPFYFILRSPNKEPTTSNKKAKTKTHRERTKMTRDYKEIYSDKGKSIGQKEVEQMKGTREMSNEERKQSKRKKHKESEGSGREVP